MKQRSIRFLIAGIALTGLLASGAAAASAAPPAADRTLRIMQWNIQGAVAAGGGEADEERIAAVIAAENPDIVTLEEVHLDPADEGTYHGDQPARFAELLADEGFVYSQWGLAETDLPRGPGSQTGNLILSKYPFAGEPELVELPNENYEPGGKLRRTMIGIAVDVPGFAHRLP